MHWITLSMTETFPKCFPYQKRFQSTIVMGPHHPPAQRAGATQDPRIKGPPLVASAAPGDLDQKLRETFDSKNYEWMILVMMIYMYCIYE